MSWILAAAAQFNLICVGTLTTIAPRSFTDKTELYRHEYRLDLDANRWCANDCQFTQAFASLSPAQITFEEKANSAANETSSFTNVVNRKTWEHFAHSKREGDATGPVTMDWIGKCKQAPFTGFSTGRAP
jgi:hypothetical protein